MNIEKVTVFQHPPNSKKTWKGKLFNPLSDLKFELSLGDGNTIEAGVFKMLVDGHEELHACISTQAGCKFDCSFCSSGKNGFARNLTAEEILSEISLLEDYLEVSNFKDIVFMGIGEPLDNYESFVTSVRTLVTQKPAYEGRLSFATVGLPHKLKRLAKEDLPHFKMVWISLHASTDEKRSIIMPANKAFSIDQVLNAAKEYALGHASEVWINYLVYRGFNDTEEDARKLAKLLEGSENYFSVMITEPNNNLELYDAGDIVDLKRFEKYMKDCGLNNKTYCFVAAGKAVNAGCGEFIFSKP